MTQANIIIEDIPATVQGVSAKLVRFQGQLDESNVDEKAKIIYQLLEQNPSGLYLLFDFDQLEYMNSKSIGYLTDWYGKITEGQGKIVIAKPKSNILDILQVVGLTQLINCYQSLDEAKFALLQGLAGSPEATPASAPTPAPSADPSAGNPPPAQGV
jgi:anti-anti-sigma factor